MEILVLVLQFWRMIELRKAAILQSNYIPWKGVFDMMNQVDVFVFLEDVQFTRRDWRSRNVIKTANGTQWLTVPIKKCSRDTKICDVEINNDKNWRNKHYNSIVHNYSRADYFEDYKYILDDIYSKERKDLSAFNIYTNKYLSKILGIEVEFVNSCDLNTSGTKDDKLIQICKKVGADSYLSGPAAKNYIVKEKFEDAGVKLEYIEYNYPKYKQLYGNFNHYVTVLDTIFNCGKDFKKYIFN